MSADRWEPGAEHPPVFDRIEPQTPPPVAATNLAPPEPPSLPITDSGRTLEQCPVPGCAEMITQFQLGPHLKMHRNRQDPGTPPPKRDTLNKAARKAKAAKNPQLPCPVPGCDLMIHRNAMGTHLRGHRNHGDPGTPTSASAASAAPKAKANDAPKRVAKPIIPLTSEDITNGVLVLLYPTGVPLDRLRAVTAWVAATEQLATEALAAQTKMPQP